MGNQFDFFLEPELKELFVTLFEASRNIPRENRPKFVILNSNYGTIINHTGFPDGELRCIMEDIEALGNENLISIDHSKSSTPFYITQEGIQYYEQLKEQDGQPTQRIEKTINNHLNNDTFRKKHPISFQKWETAEKMLWGSDSVEQDTSIGHTCREAVQEFVTELLDIYKVETAENNKSQIIRRFRDVLNQREEKIGKTEKPFLDALMAYWGTLSDLIQRQEHGSQKEGKPLVWEDGRRVVFQTAVVMFEIDSCLSRQMTE